MKLSVIAIKNHPDICGVVEYLENLDLVPAQYGDLVFAMPSENYVDTFEAPIEWYKCHRSNCVVVNPDTGMSAYVAYSKSADTIVALADVLPGTAEMPSPDEQAISLHILSLLEKNGYDRRDIDVEYTSDPPETPEDDPVKELFDSLTPVAYREQLAITAFNRCIPDAKFDPLSISVSSDGGQAIYADIPFVLGGTNFVCRFKTMWRCTDKEWEHFMFIWPEADESDELAIKDPYNAREELVNFYFKFPYFAERKFNDRLPEFTEKSVGLTADGTLEWKGTFRGKEITIKFKDGIFSFVAKGKTETLSGGGLPFITLKANLDYCIMEADTGCPLCSGKEVTFGSETLHFQRDGRTGEVNVYKDGLYAGCAEWKFCPECGRKL